MADMLPGLKTFLWEEIKDKDVIGAGAFGGVITGKRENGITVVLKKLLRQNNNYERRLFYKECRLLAGLENKHIVKLQAVCESPLAMMMEYVYFDFGVLDMGLKGRSSSVRDFLDFVSTNAVVDKFADLATKIAKDVAMGLDYLHSNEVAHRDLKPGNVLISNQHYSHFTDKSIIRRFWQNEPILCKLADFGESRSSRLQTASVCHTMTHNVDRGTVVYMAPELLSSSNVHPMSVSNLMKGDIWGYGMVLFTLLNPDLSYPFERELSQIAGEKGKAKDLLRHFHELKQKPNHSSKHSQLQATKWPVIDDLYESCTIHNPLNRPSTKDVLQHLRSRSNDANGKCRNFCLSISQNSAIEQADHLLAAGNPASHPITNDGSNSCAFLSVITAASLTPNPQKELNRRQKLLGDALGENEFWKKLVEVADDIIISSPETFNPLRHSGRFYDVFEAHEILSHADIIESNIELSEKVLCSDGVFSKDGRTCLEKIINNFYTCCNEPGAAIFTCGHYIFTIGRRFGSLFVVETHQIHEELGGNGNGLLKVFSPCPGSPFDLCTWIWHRLASSKVPADTCQSFITLHAATSYPFLVVLLQKFLLCIMFSLKTTLTIYK